MVGAGVDPFIPTLRTSLLIILGPLKVQSALNISSLAMLSITMTNVCIHATAKLKMSHPGIGIPGYYFSVHFDLVFLEAKFVKVSMTSCSAIRYLHRLAVSVEVG